MAKTMVVCGLLALACGGAFAATGHPAGINERIGSEQVNATGACAPALPVFESQLRRRPVAIANEGSAPAFLSCSLTTNGRLNFGYFELLLTVRNRGPSAATVNCTLVTGGNQPITVRGQTFHPRTLEVGAGEAATLWWFADGEEIADFDVLANFSCVLPAGVELGSLGGAYHSV